MPHFMMYRCFYLPSRSRTLNKRYSVSRCMMYSVSRDRSMSNGVKRILWSNS